MFTQKSTSILLVFLICTINICNSFPYFLIQSTKPKCVKLEVPHDTLLQITYDSPDLTTKERKKEAPATIKISHLGEVINGERTGRKMKPKKVKPTIVDVRDNTGKIMYKGEGDGELLICVTVKNVQKNNPVRFGLKGMYVLNTKLIKFLKHAHTFRLTT